MVQCPKCKSSNTAPVLYGYPRFIAFDAVEKGEIILGGCEVIDGMEKPDYGCFDCEFRWSTNLLPPECVKKIRYKVEENGLCAADVQKRFVYEIYLDGRCIKYSYIGQSRKYIFKEIEITDRQKVYQLFSEFQQILGAPLWKRNIIEAEVCDGSSYTLQISYNDNRKKVITGDIGGGTFDMIIERFLKRIFQQ